MSDDNKKKILSLDQSFINTLITSERSLCVCVCVDRSLAENLEEKRGDEIVISHSPFLPLETPFIIRSRMSNFSKGLKNRYMKDLEQREGELFSRDN